MAAENGTNGGGATAEKTGGSLRLVYSGRSGDSDPREEIPELGFRDYWYPIVGVNKVRRRRPLRIKVLGDDLCVFQGKSGPAVISNICPHRGASIGGGKCQFKGTVSCPYHGWTFDESGTCVAVLSEGPTSTMPGRASVRKYPTVLLKGIVFAWMGDGGPVEPEKDLPPELFDDKTLVMHDATLWKANWRLSIENMNDNHAPYTHRNSIQLLLRPFVKRSYKGARPIISGGGITLTHYNDYVGKKDPRPYREFISSVDGYWPKTTYRLWWAPIFRLRVFKWITVLGQGTRGDGARHDNNFFHQGTREFMWEWNQGIHMPGMLSINGGTALYRRWCVPIDERTTRLFYLYAVRPATQWGGVREKLKYPIANKMLRNRNLGMQDGTVLEQTVYSAPEHFSPFDVETMGWRRLAILSARSGGRHDAISSDLIEQSNKPALKWFETHREGTSSDEHALNATQLQADVIEEETPRPVSANRHENVESIEASNR